MTYIHNKLGLAIIGALLLMIVAALGGAIYAGPLDPPGTPAPTDKTVISSLPQTISAPGSYIVKSDLTCSTCSVSVPGIEITSDNVSLDLNGFTLHQASASAVGIWTPALQDNVSIGNGALEGGTGGVGVQGDNIRIYGVSVSNVTLAGISANGSGTVEDCSVTDSTFVGIYANGVAVSNCSANSNVGAVGINIERGSLTNCVANDNETGILADGSTVTGCTVSGNTFDGIVATGATLISTASLIDGNEVFSNNGVGIFVEVAASVTNNVVTGNAEHGIEVTGSGGSIANNHVSNNGPSPYYPITVTGAFNNIDGNNIESATIGNAGQGLPVNCLSVGGTSNVITRNRATGSTGTCFAIAGGNTAGPPETSATPLTNPWANIEY